MRGLGRSSFQAEKEVGKGWREGGWEGEREGRERGRERGSEGAREGATERERESLQLMHDLERERESRWEIFGVFDT